MHNAKIIRIDENIFKGRTKERKLFDRKILNNVTTINNPTIIRTEDDDVYGGETKDGKPHGKGILKYYYNGNADGRYVGEFKDDIDDALLAAAVVAYFLPVCVRAVGRETLFVVL